MTPVKPLKERNRSPRVPGEPCRSNIMIGFTASEYRQIDGMAQQQGISRSWLIRRIVAGYFKALEAKKAKTNEEAA